MKINHLTSLALVLGLATCNAADEKSAAAPAAAASSSATAADGWVSMFNGKDLTNWKSNEETPGS
ncbi:MAG TPA: hypothetical protein VGE29_08475, partial [Prosthecobacter sp.]